MRQEYIVHNLMLDGYSNNLMQDPLIPRAAELRQQGITVREGDRYAHDSTSSLIHWIEYDDAVHPVKSKPKTRQVVGRAL